MEKVEQSRFSRNFELFLPEYFSDVEAVAMDKERIIQQISGRKYAACRHRNDRYHMQAQFGKDVLGVVRLDEAKAHNEQSKRIKESITPDKTLRRNRSLRKLLRWKALNIRS